MAFSELFAQLWLLQTYTIQGGAQSVSDAGKINMDALSVSYLSTSLFVLKTGTLK